MSVKPETILAKTVTILNNLLSDESDVICWTQLARAALENNTLKLFIELLLNTQPIQTVY